LSNASYTLNGSSSSLSMGTFSGNTFITDVNFDDGVKIYCIDKMIDDPYKSAAYLFNGCTSLLRVFNLPDNINTIANGFSNCTSLVEAPILPMSLNAVESTFVNCTSLRYISHFPDNISLFILSFTGCTNLEYVPEFPTSVRSILLPFGGCSNLTGEIIIASTEVGTVMNMFNDTSKNIILKVPAGSTTYNTFVNNNLPSNITLVGF